MTVLTAETLLALFLTEARERSAWSWTAADTGSSASLALVATVPSAVRAQLLVLAAEALAQFSTGTTSARYDSAWSPALGFLVAHLVEQRDLELDAEILSQVASHATAWPAWDWLDTPPYDPVLSRMASVLAGQPVPARLATELRQLRVRLAMEGAWDDDQRRRLASIDGLLASRPRRGFDPSDVWGESFNAWIEALEPTTAAAWWEVVDHAALARRSAPSRRWLVQAERGVARIGGGAYVQALTLWLPRVPVGLTRAQIERRQELLARYENRVSDDLPHALGESNRTRVRGLLWAAARCADPSIVAVLAASAARCYARVPLVGVGDAKLGHAAVRALSLRSGAAANQALIALVPVVDYQPGKRLIERMINRP